MHFEHILITTDLSDLSTAAFEMSALESKMEGSKLTLLHVCPDYEVPVEISRQIFNPENLRLWREEYLEKTQKKLEALAEKHFHSQKVDSRVVFARSKAVGDTVCEFAAENNCDLILCASRSRGELATLFLGSTAQKIIAKAHCPVMLVKLDSKV